MKQYKADKSACIQSVDSAGYHVNYKAKPYPGWRFLRWEGPCAPDSNFQNCRLDVSEAEIARWDETYADRAIPPSTAIFQRISGETGFLLAPGAVTGVYYETPTQRGVTGLDGSFQYENGETIRFTLGDTVLGEVAGKEVITPFDLAGSTVLTGLGINWALLDEGEPFQSVVNIAVLLHSVDHDANPKDGIQIRSSVAELFDGLSLDVAQHWQTFQSDSRLRVVLGKSSRTQRFSKPHGVVKPDKAVSYLYEGLEIDARIIGATQRLGVAPYPEEFFEYDSHGNMIRHGDGTSDALESWKYDAGGNVVRREAQDEYGNSEVETWKYDDSGNLVYQDSERYWDSRSEKTRRGWEYDVNNNLVKNRHGTRWYYDEKGNLVRKAWNHAPDGTAYNFEKWNYDNRGKLRLYKEQYSTGSDPFVGTIKSWRYEYDEAGKLTALLMQMKSEHPSSGRVQRSGTETWQYDDNSRLIRTEWLDSDDGSTIRERRWEYGSSGELTRYECYGRLCTAEDEFTLQPVWPTSAADPEVEIDQARTWQYHPNGNISLEEVKKPTSIPDSLWHRLEELPTDIDPALTEDNSIHTLIERYYFDIDGNLTRYESGSDFSEIGTFDINSVQNWDYDSDGNLIYTKKEREGSTRLEESWHYSKNGTLLRHEKYHPGMFTIRYRYERTGWGYLFAGTLPWGHDYPVPPKPIAEPDPRY